MIEAGKDTQDNQSGALTRIFQLVKQAGEHQRWKELAPAERFALEAQEVAKGEFSDTKARDYDHMHGQDYDH